MGGLFKKKKSEEPAPPSIQGPRDITDTAAGPLFLKYGQQFVENPQGLGPDFVERTSRPDISQIEAGYRENVLPEISQELASRGVSRSSIGADLISRALQAKQRDIASILGGAFGQQAQAKQAERFTGLGALGQGTQLGISAGANQANLANARYLANLERAQRQQELEQQRRLSLLGLGIQGAGTFLGYGGLQSIANALNRRGAPSAIP